MPESLRRFNVYLAFWLRNVFRPTTACTFSTSQLPKVLRTWGVLYLLTSTCASRHNGVHFFAISTSKSAPNLMLLCSSCKARSMTSGPLWARTYRLTVTTPGVFCPVWLRNVLRATTACNFSSLIWPDGSAPAALASRLFDPPGPQIIGKTQWFGLFYLFAHLHVLSSDSFSSLIFFFLLFLLWLFPPAFSSVHIVGSLTSKLPSIIWYQIFEFPELDAGETCLNPLFWDAKTNVLSETLVISHGC